MITPDNKNGLNNKPLGVTMQGEYIKEASWSKMLNFFKNSPGMYMGKEKDLKGFIESVYWIMRTGAQWRELPEKYGKWNSVFKRFNMWSRKGIWNKLFDYCAEDPDLEYVMIDTTIVRAHACAAGYGKQEAEGLGRSHGGFTTKIHAKVDALGNILKFIVTPGQRSDITQAEKLIKGTTEAFILADKGYDSDALRLQIEKQNCTSVIPGKSNRKIAIEHDKHIYKERHLVECFFSKIKYFRRLFSRFDKSIANFKSMLSFAGAILWLR
jgi:transposase